MHLLHGIPVHRIVIGLRRQRVERGGGKTLGQANLAQDLHAVLGMQDLGMELHAREPPIDIFECGNRYAGRPRRDDESGRCDRDAFGIRVPDDDEISRFQLRRHACDGHRRGACSDRAGSVLAIAEAK